MVEPALTFWVIYDHPKDYPDHWVVRRTMVGAGGRMFMHPEVTLHATLQEARNAVPDHLIRIPHQPTEDPVIYETWM